MLTIAEEQAEKRTGDRTAVADTNTAKVEFRTAKLDNRLEPAQTGVLTVNSSATRCLLQASAFLAELQHLIDDEDMMIASDIRT